MGEMALNSRLLGLAFASADTLVEIDGEGRIVLRFAGPVTQRVMAEQIGPALEKAAQ